MKYKPGCFWTTANAFNDGTPGGQFVKIQTDKDGKLYGIGCGYLRFYEYVTDYPEHVEPVEVTIDFAASKVQGDIVTELTHCGVDIDSAKFVYTEPTRHECCSYDCYNDYPENGVVEVSWPTRVYLTKAQIKAYQRQQELGPTWKEEARRKREHQKQVELDKKRKLLEKLKRELGES